MIEKKYRIQHDASDGNDKGIVTLRDTLDSLGAQEIANEIIRLLQRGCTDWDVDLNELPFCDSSTLGTCAMLHMTVRKHSGKIRFHVEADSQIHRLLQTSKLDKILSLDTN